MAGLIVILFSFSYWLPSVKGFLERKKLFTLVNMLVWAQIVIFLQHTYYRTAFLICTENRAENTAMFYFLLSRAYTELRILHSLTPPYQ